MNKVSKQICFRPRTNLNTDQTTNLNTETADLRRFSSYDRTSLRFLLRTKSSDRGDATVAKQLQEHYAREKLHDTDGAM